LAAFQQVVKLRRRLDSALGQRQFYEAHQIMRTIHWRIIQQYEQTAAAEPQKNPSAEAQVEDLLKMLRVGCITMCDGEEQGWESAVSLDESCIQLGSSPVPSIWPNSMWMR
jgi:hypothetical protein